MGYQKGDGVSDRGMEYKIVVGYQIGRMGYQMGMMRYPMGDEVPERRIGYQIGAPPPANLTLLPSGPLNPHLVPTPVWPHPCPPSAPPVPSGPTPCSHLAPTHVLLHPMPPIWPPPISPHPLPSHLSTAFIWSYPSWLPSHLTPIWLGWGTPMFISISPHIG